MWIARVVGVARAVWPAVWRTALILSATYTARAGGPRWVTGPPYFSASAGQAVSFYTPDVLYYTDPGNLSLQVSHAAADAMVANAAAVWNVSVARLTLAQGGTLAEHVSSGNTYFDGTRLQLPADVQPTNYRSKPIAVVYDTDGGVIDTLLGSGASAVSSCRQNGVVEDVDDLNADGTIHHALLLINGRCATSTGDALTQLQYQLTRAFGRVLGVGWSQLNDDVFTGTPTPTAAEADNWPLMHPIDVVCGLYTFQCMRDPFRLRDDDIATLVWLYPVTTANAVAGKTESAKSAHMVVGTLTFGTGQGMQMVNAVARRQMSFTAKPEDADLVSTVIGVRSQVDRGNPVSGQPTDAVHSAGNAEDRWFGDLLFPYMPITGTTGWDEFLFHTESINPLYVGEYAVAPYLGEAPEMSGSALSGVETVASANSYGSQTFHAAADAASTCAPGNDGTEAMPAVPPATGFWIGQFCAMGHSSWFEFAPKAGRSFTVEITALDEGGGATTHKARPVTGAWLTSDAPQTLPTVAAQTTAFNALATGVTALRVQGATTGQSMRFAVAEERGYGRPDFGYSARIFYVDEVTPAAMPAAGGPITIVGKGFRGGNVVLVNGVAATVQSLTPTTIVAVAPAMAAARVTAAEPVADVSVVDGFTGGSSMAQGALTYSGADTYTVSAAGLPQYVAAGAAAGWSASVLVRKNGAAIAAKTVSWTASAGMSLAAALDSSDAGGVASVSVSTAGLAGGSVGAVTGCVATGVCASTNVYSVAASQWQVSAVAGAMQSVPASQTLAPVTVMVSDGSGHPLQGATVTVYQTVTAWQGLCPVHGRCPAAAVLARTQTQAVADANGLVVVVPLEVPGVASTVNLAVAAGTQGFTALTLSKTL